MKIIVCGCGNVGFNIATYLEKYDNHVVATDNSPELVRKISDRHDIQGVCGFASDPEVLSRAGAQDADMIIAVTHHDEVNIVACEVAHALFNIPTKIARIRNQAYLQPQYVHLFDETNISIDVTISPEVEVARAISHGLTVPGAFRIIPMADGRINIIGVKCTAATPIINTPITHITSIFPEVNFRVVAIYRDSGPMIPQENELILAGDEVFFAAAQEQVVAAIKAFGHYESHERRIIILGCGNVGLCLAQMVEKSLPNIDVRLIESSQERAQLISKQLSRSIVINGDSLEGEILEEAGVSTTETVIAVTQDDKVNTLASLLAKRLGAKRAQALINNPSSNSLVTSLGVDSVINPREITVSSILQHVRRGYIRSVHTLKEGLGEIIEAEVHENSGLIGSSLLDIEVPGQIMVAAILRKAEAIIPSQTTTIQLEDRIIMVVAKQTIKEVEKMFSARLEYF